MTRRFRRSSPRSTTGGNAPAGAFRGLAAGLVTAALMVAGCGRSAPEGATGSADGSEPAAAGVRVVSEQTVVAPSSTIAPPSSTTPTTTAPPTSQAGPSQTYIVQPGDTLSVIAGQFDASIEAISEANGITDVNSIRPGQELIIPGG